MRLKRRYIYRIRLTKLRPCSLRERQTPTCLNQSSGTLWVRRLGLWCCAYFSLALSFFPANQHCVYAAGFQNWTYHGIVVHKGEGGDWDGAGIASPGAAVAADGTVIIGYAFLPSQSCSYSSSLQAAFCGSQCNDNTPAQYSRAHACAPVPVR